MKNKLKLATAVALLGASLGANANYIDLFEHPTVAEGGNQIVTDNSNGDGGVFDQYYDNPSSDTIMGDYRDIYVECLSGCTGINGTVTAVQPTEDSGGTTTEGTLIFNTDTGVDSAAFVRWDGDNTSTGNGSPTDAAGIAAYDDYGTAYNGLSADIINQEGCAGGQCDAFVFTIYGSDAGDGVGGEEGLWYFTIEAWTDEDTFTRYVLEATIVKDEPVVSVIPFDFFTNDVFCTLAVAQAVNENVSDVECGSNDVVSLTDLGALMIRFNVGATFDTPLSGANIAGSIDLQIGSIRKVGVPEPSILGLMGAGFLAAGLVRTRRRRNIKA